MDEAGPAPPVAHRGAGVSSGTIPAYHLGTLRACPRVRGARAAAGRGEHPGHQLIPVYASRSLRQPSRAGAVGGCGDDQATRRTGLRSLNDGTCSLGQDTAAAASEGCGRPIHPGRTHHRPTATAQGARTRPAGIRPNSLIAPGPRGAKGAQANFIPLRPRRPGLRAGTHPHAGGRPGSPPGTTGSVRPARCPCPPWRGRPSRPAPWWTRSPRAGCRCPWRPRAWPGSPRPRRP